MSSTSFETADEENYVRATSFEMADGENNVGGLQSASQVGRSISRAEKADLNPVDVPTEEAPGTRCVDFKLLWAYTGPGWLMSIAYLDPGNLEADLQSGAYAGNQLLWMLFWATVAGFILQVLALRLGVVTGKHLAQVCREEYSRPTSLVLWVMTETAIIGSDIQEVVGSAIAFKLLFGWSIVTGCIVTGLDTFTFLLLHIFGTRALEAFFASLIFTMLVCFFVNFAAVGPDWLGDLASVDGGGILFGTAVPTVNDYALVQAVGILGAVIMPHNIYLHSALVTSRNVNRENPREVALANKYFTIEAAVALFVSFLINGAVVSVFAKGFFNGKECAVPGWETTTGVSGGLNQSAQNLACYPVTAALDDDACHFHPETGKMLACTTHLGQTGSCCSIGLQNAGAALEGLLGKSAKIVWAIGLLAAGQSSTMTGTFAGQFVMEGFLQWKISPWVRVAVTRSIALGPAILVGIVSANSPSATDILNEWLNVLQSIQLPFALLPVLHFTSDERIMGKFANNKMIKGGCWFLAALVIVINFYLVTTFVGAPDSPTPSTPLFFAFCILVGVVYSAFICYVIRSDLEAGWNHVKRFLYGSSMDARTPLLGVNEVAGKV